MSANAPHATQEPNMKSCPYCRKEILAVAIKCRFCKGDLEDDREEAPLPSPSPTENHLENSRPSMTQAEPRLPQAAGIPTPPSNLGPLPGEDPPTNEEQKTKLCPYCRKEILAVAIKCRHCKGDLVDGGVGTQDPPIAPAQVPPIPQAQPIQQTSPIQQAPPSAQPYPASSKTGKVHLIQPLDFMEVLVLGILTLGIYIYAKFYQVGKTYQTLSTKESKFSLRFWGAVVVGVLLLYTLTRDYINILYIEGVISLTVRAEQIFIPLLVLLSVLNVYLVREFIKLYEDIAATHGLDVQVQDKRTFLVLGCISLIPILGLITIGLFLARLCKLNNQLATALQQENSEDLPRTSPNPASRLNPSVQNPTPDSSSKATPQGEDRSESVLSESSENRIILPKLFAGFALLVGVLGCIASANYLQRVEDKSQRISEEINKYHKMVSDGTKDNFLGSTDFVHVILEAFGRLESSIETIVDAANLSLFVKLLVSISLIFVVWGLWNRSWWSRRVILFWSAFAGSSIVLDIYNVALIRNTMEAFENYASNLVFGNGSENLPKFIADNLADAQVQVRNLLQTQINDPVFSQATQFLYNELVYLAWIPLLYVIVFCRPSGKKYFRARSLPLSKKN